MKSGPFQPHSNKVHEHQELHPPKANYFKSANRSRTCGEATIRLLSKHGVDTVFGIPGVHTLDFCRGLSDGTIRHVQARNEQGAGFMADGYARIAEDPV